MCRKCTGQIGPLKELPAESVVIGNVFLEVVDYLSDMISTAGCVEECIVGRIRCGWKKFKELLPSVFTAHTN